jgi:predicted membrane-bound mannosyltransferase
LGFILFSVFLIYTGWGLDGSGIYKLLQSLLFWAQTGVGKTGHEKVWYYWVDLVSRYEIWFFLALSGGALTLGPVNKVTRVMAVFSLGNLIAYSLIPYKTPWLILNILWPATLLFGVGVERLLEIIRDSSRKWLRWSIGPAILLVFILAGYKSWYLNFMAPASAKEPYVYVQSTQAWGQFWNVLQTYTKERPVLKNEPVAIAIKQSWPLPYLFGRYTAADLRIDLVTVFQSPELLKKYSLIILDLEDEEKLGDAMKSSGYLRKQMELRDGMDPVVIFLRAKEYADMIPLIDGLKPI